MEQKIVTSIEQSKKLLELGLDPKTANMLWAKLSITDDYPVTLMVKAFSGSMQFQGEDLMIPAWSLSALLGLMPKDRFIDIELSYGGFSVDPLEYIEKWFISFENEKDYESDIKTFSSEHPIDVVFEMVCWLLENGFIEKVK